MPPARAFQNFGYCVWRCPAPDHPWNAARRRGEGPRAHLSVRTRILSKSGARAARRLRCPDHREPVDVRLEGRLRQTVTPERFYALEHAVRVDGSRPPPAWWPAHAHVSFGYRYGRPFTQDEIQQVARMIAGHRTARLGAARVWCCDGHWATWQEVRARRRRGRHSSAPVQGA